MKQLLQITLFFAVLLTSCISQKKYDEKVGELTLAENRIHHLKQDSIAKQNRINSLIKDSAEMAEKYSKLKKQKDSVSSVSVPNITYYKQTIGEDKEYELKAIYVYNIATGSEWDNKYKMGDFVIGILGKSKMADQLKTTLATKKKSGQNFKIEEYGSVSAIKGCHLLFISKGFYASFGSIKNKIAEFPALFVSEEDYTGTLTHFNLVTDGEKIKMFVNKDAIKKAPFKVTKNLLNMAAN